MCRKRCRASVTAESEGLAAVVALERHVSRHLAHSYTIAHALGSRFGQIVTTTNCFMEWTFTVCIVTVAVVIKR